VFRFTSQIDDIKPIEFPVVTWDGGASASSLESLRGHVTAQAKAAINWYLNKRGPKRFYGRLVRLSAMVVIAVAGAIPILVQIFAKDGKPAIDPSWTSIALAFAAFLISLDYFFGFTTGWCRYLESQQKITRTTEDFEWDWEILRAGWGGQNPSAEQVRAALARLKAATSTILQIVEDETAAWVAEFKSSIKMIDEAARAKVEAAPLPAANVSLENGTDVEGDWSLAVDDGSPVKQRGTRAALTGLRPGPHKFTVEGKIAGAVKRDEVSVDVPVRGVAEVKLKLQ
jgi:hypothetical protein